MDLGPWEIAIIAVVVLVLFGSKKLPDAARSLGRSLRIFKAEVKDMHGEDEQRAAEVAPHPVAQQLPAAHTVPTTAVTSGQAAPQAAEAPAVPAEQAEHR